MSVLEEMEGTTVRREFLFGRYYGQRITKRVLWALGKDFSLRLGWPRSGEISNVVSCKI